MYSNTYYILLSKKVLYFESVSPKKQKNHFFLCVFFHLDPQLRAKCILQSSGPASIQGESGSSLKTASPVVG